MPPKSGSYRWKVVVLLFFATTINYIDRQVLGVLAPQLQEEFAWSESDYGFIVSCFQIAYALGLLLSGRWMDKIGVKAGYSIAIVLWSLAGMLHAFAVGLFSFGGMRFLLGFAESANYPASVKTVAEWFPKKERALATGIFNSGSNIGAIVTPLLIPFIALNWGWRAAFIGTGLLGFIWLIGWLIVYKKPERQPKVTPAELKYIQQDGEDPVMPISWRQVIFRRQTIGVSLSLFLTAPIWWFFLYWLPKFLNTNMNIGLDGIALPLIIIYVVSDAGAIAGGWFSSALVKKGTDPVVARKKSIFLLALLALPVFFVPWISHLWVVVAFISLATFGHQGYASNIFTIISDVFPKNAVGAVTGVAMFVSAIGGVLFSYFVGWTLERTGSYQVIFGMASVAYLLSWVVLHLFVKSGRAIALNGRV